MTPKMEDKVNTEEQTEQTGTRKNASPAAVWASHPATPEQLRDLKTYAADQGTSAREILNRAFTPVWDQLVAEIDTTRSQRAEQRAAARVAAKVPADPSEAVAELARLEERERRTATQIAALRASLAPTVNPEEVAENTPADDEAPSGVYRTQAGMVYAPGLAARAERQRR